MQLNCFETNILLLPYPNSPESKAALPATATPPPTPGQAHTQKMCSFLHLKAWESPGRATGHVPPQMVRDTSRQKGMRRPNGGRAGRHVSIQAAPSIAPSHIAAPWNVCVLLNGVRLVSGSGKGEFSDRMDAGRVICILFSTFCFLHSVRSSSHPCQWHTGQGSSLFFRKRLCFSKQVWLTWVLNNYPDSQSEFKNSLHHALLR